MNLRNTLLLAAASLVIAAPVSAQQAAQRRVPAGAVEMKSSFAPVVSKSAPAVVNVFSSRQVRRNNDFWDFFGGGGQPMTQQSLGSGAIVRADGVVVTNNHVVEGMTDIKVVLADRRQFPARVLLADKRSDLAVLKIDPGTERLPVINIDIREDPQVGDLVLAIGNPFGVGQTVTNGIVSALARTDVGITDYSFFIQTDAAINPGNSGGPLVDMDGDLIGLNTAIFSRTGGSNGIGFAIPAVMVSQVIESALRGSQTVERPWLGLRADGISSMELARSLDLTAPRGVVVTKLYPRGPADRAGIEEGDVILAIDGQAVNDETAVTYRVGTKRAGEQVRLQLWRNGREQSVNATVQPLPSGTNADRRTITQRNPLTGAVVANLSPAEAERLGLDPFQEGVVVAEVARGTIAGQRFQAGDVILQVNDDKVSSTADLDRLLAIPVRGWRITFQRGGRVGTLAISS